jgi:hypothetical protein
MPFSRDASDAVLPVFALARIYILTGNHAGAIQQLRLLLAVPSNMSGWRLKLDPAFDPLRREPEFQALLKE